MTKETASGLLALISLTAQGSVLSVVYGARTGLGALLIIIGIGLLFTLVEKLGQEAS